MDENYKMGDDFVRLARLALTANDRDILLFLRRMARRYRKAAPNLSIGFSQILKENPTRVSPLRKAGVPTPPVDLDSRLQLIRIETDPVLEIEPVFAKNVFGELQQVVKERKQRSRLVDAGLEPTKTALFTGPPGVGKTLAARWLAHEMQVPLLILDLSAVMSSYLGRTGSNVRQVLDYAKDVDCILLLDELDAIAKRRDDISEIGELKRLVTVLLQEIDNWPPRGLIIAATNHPDLLDPAVWRRFERIVDFPMPQSSAIAIAIERFFGPLKDAASEWIPALSIALDGLSFSDIERDILTVRRLAALDGVDLSEQLLPMIRNTVGNLNQKHRIELAMKLVNTGAVSQRQSQELTGVSRDTIRKRIQKTTCGGG